MQSVLPDKSKHDRNRFNCGIDALNNYLKVMASQHSKKDNTRTFVLEDKTNPQHIVGFYTLTMIPVDMQNLPASLQKKHQCLMSGGLIARLAVDERYKGRKTGEWLLIDALKKLLQASDTVGFPVVIVDVKDGAKVFYQKYGFRSFEDAEHKLFITIADVRASFG